MKTFFTVGPSQLYPTYQEHYLNALKNDIGSISHRSVAFRALYKFADQQLKTLLQIPDTHAIFFASSASEIWERIILNTVYKTSFHFINGAFAQKFKDYSEQLGKTALHHTVAHGAFLDMNTIEIPDEVELICTTQNETSTGSALDAEILKKIKLKYPNKLICTDIVSSAPLQTVDFEYMDMAFFSVQKAFGMPAGLGVWIVKKSILDHHNELKKHCITSPHNSLSYYFKNYEKWETPSTPNVMAIYCLGKIAEDFNTIGLSTLRKEAELKRFFLHEELSKILFLKKAITHKQESLSVVVYNTIPQIELENEVLVLGKGYGEFINNQIRIANFPALQMTDMENLVFELKNENLYIST
jgi:phosphoserine aminotransferase